MRLLAAVLVSSCLGCNAIFGVEGGHVDSGEIHIQGAPFDFDLEVDQGQTTKHVASSVHVELGHAFALDEDEVTVARFKAWVDDGQPVPSEGQKLDPGGPYDGAMRWSDALKAAAQKKSFAAATGCQIAEGYANGGPDATTFELGNDSFPMTCVSWAQAVAFCASEGKRLPPNAEWQFAAQAGDEKRGAPFAGGATCDHAIIDPGDGSECGFPVPVGTATGRSKDGVLDMGGSVVEWTWDAYDYEAGKPLEPTESDGYAGIGDNAANHLLRGGEYFTPAKLALIQNGHAFAGDTSSVNDVGLRCARTILPPD
jgi:formylglycine-generating enzyme